MKIKDNDDSNDAANGDTGLETDFFLYFKGAQLHLHKLL